MKKQLHFLMTGLLTFVIIQNVSAQWQITTGPSSPNVVGLCASGTDLFSTAGGAIGTTGGMIALTTNNGNVWTLVNTGLSGHITSLVKKGTDIFAGSDVGVYQTSNNGGNWTNTSSGLPAYATNCLTVSGTDIYAGTFGIYKSTNSGLLWTQLNLSWNGNVYGIAVRNDTILAATLASGIHMSTDGGTTWNAINTGLPTQVNAVIMYGNTFLAGTNTGLYISTNFGASWTITNVTNAIGSFTVIGSNLFAGSYTGGGVFQSTNGGALWSTINTGLSNLTVYSLEYNSTYLFAGTTGNVFRRLLTDLITTTVVVNDLENVSSFTVAPNPFTTQTTISFNTNQQNTTIRITDVLGKEIKTINFTGRQLVIDKAEMKAGIYFVQTTDEKKHISYTKIVIQ